MELDLDALTATKGFWYLATPYSRYQRGIGLAFLAACRAAAWLVHRGVRIYCPIAHTHPVALAGGIDPLDHAVWLPADRPFMAAAHGLIVCRLDGWAESYGIGEEIKVFLKAGKPVIHWQPPAAVEAF